MNNNINNFLDDLEINTAVEGLDWNNNKDTESLLKEIGDTAGCFHSLFENVSLNDIYGFMSERGFILKSDSLKELKQKIESSSSRKLPDDFLTPIGAIKEYLPLSICIFTPSELYDAISENINLTVLEKDFPQLHSEL